jgi:hypothetical protein
MTTIKEFNRYGEELENMLLLRTSPMLSARLSP